MGEHRCFGTATDRGGLPISPSGLRLVVRLLRLLAATKELAWLGSGFELGLRSGSGSGSGSGLGLGSGSGLG